MSQQQIKFSAITHALKVKEGISQEQLKAVLPTVISLYELYDENEPKANNTFAEPVLAFADEEVRELGFFPTVMRGVDLNRRDSRNVWTTGSSDIKASFPLWVHGNYPARHFVDNKKEMPARVSALAVSKVAVEDEDVIPFHAEFSPMALIALEKIFAAVVAGGKENILPAISAPAEELPNYEDVFEWSEGMGGLGLTWVEDNAYYTMTEGLELTFDQQVDMLAGTLVQAIYGGWLEDFAKMLQERGEELDLGISENVFDQFVGVGEVTVDPTQGQVRNLNYCLSQEAVVEGLSGAQDHVTYWSRPERPAQLKVLLCATTSFLSLISNFSYHVDAHMAGQGKDEIAFEVATELSTDAFKALEEASPSIVSVLSGGELIVKGEFSEAQSLRTKFAVGTHENEELEELVKNSYIPSLVGEWTSIVSSTDCAIRNFQMTGDPAAGKSHLTKLMAYTLGLAHYTESGVTDRLSDSDWFGRLQPRTAEAVDASGNITKVNALEELYVENGLFVTEETIDVMPGQAYLELFGTISSVHPEDMESKEFKNYLRRELRNQQRAIEATVNLKGNDDFVMVLTELGKAAIYGGVIEIQEPDMARDVAGNAAGLYEFLNEGTFTLPDGRKLKRHPNCLLFVTNNADSAACQPLPEAFLSRMQIKKNFNEFDSGLVAKRVATSVGIDLKIAKEMARVIELLVDEAHQKSILDGSVGPREMEAWAVVYKATGNLKDSATYTVVEKFSQDPDNRMLAESLVASALAAVK